LLGFTRSRTPPDWRGWRHITKLDPDRSLEDARLDLVLRSSTDAIVIGGTQGITRNKVGALLDRLTDCPKPVAIEISGPDSIVPGADLYFIPLVLNSPDARWIVGAHQEALRALGALVPWDFLVPEGYLVLNPDSAVARLTAARTDLDAENVAAFVRLGERLLRLPVIYLEYSGAYGSPEIVDAAKSAISSSRLFYGGGVDGPEKARQMGRLADTIVVGNLVYAETPPLAEVVSSVKG
jgi:putative glycerol-1-phosphate prenyltransferase